MRWRLNDPITKTELRRLLEREKAIRANCENEMNLARKERDNLESLYKSLRQQYKGV